MKIVSVDNFDNETSSDVLIAENVLANYAREIAGFLNKKYSGDYASRFYRVVPDDYQLYIWKP